MRIPIGLLSFPAALGPSCHLLAAGSTSPIPVNKTRPVRVANVGGTIIATNAPTSRLFVDVKGTQN